jgi:3-deoxy-manno-octulosonate cytidylyltransferase (CMP-KDO synthetase)
MDTYPFKKHIGMYAYRSDILPGLCSLEPGELEMAESLEQLRWLENGYQILVGTTDHAASGIDTPEDLKKARIRWENEHS